MQVETQLSDLLIYLLNKYERIELQDIGVFTIVSLPARLDEVTKQIHPPCKELRLVAPEGKDPHLMDLAYENKLITSSQVQSFNDLISQKGRELTEQSTTTIEGLGTIIRRQNVSLLQASVKQVFDIGHYLPSININPVTGSKANEEFTKSEIVESPRPYAGSMKDQKIVLNDYSSPWLQYVLPLFLLFAGIIVIVLVFKYCSTAANNVLPAPAKNQSMERAPDDIDPLAIRDSRDIFHNEILNRYKDVLTQQIINEGCQITVGSFSDNVNAQNMSERLDMDGYRSSLIAFEEGTRVIITFDCAEHDLIEYLRMIRREVAPQAWYYQPSDFEPEL